EFFGGGAAAAGDDGAGVAHALAGGGGAAGDEADDGLLHVRLNPCGGGFFIAAADLADHHDGLGLRVIIEEFEKIDVAGADDGIAADADAGALAVVALGKLRHDFISERAAARDHADLAGLVDVAGHDADLGLAGRDEAGAIGADHTHAAAFHFPINAHH